MMRRYLRAVPDGLSSKHPFTTIHFLCTDVPVPVDCGMVVFSSEALQNSLVFPTTLRESYFPLTCDYPTRLKRL